MEITVKLYGGLKCFAPGEQADYKLTIRDDSTVSHALAKLKIPPKTECVVLMNGRRAISTSSLEEHSTLVLFPPISGG